MSCIDADRLTGSGHLLRRVVCQLMPCSLIMLLLAGSVPGAEPSWKAAALSIDVTPSQSMFMAGYASRKTPSAGVITPLYVKILALEDAAGHRAVLITSDLISVPQPLRAQVATTAQERYQLNPHGLFINCSHTHCGPVVKDNVETSVMYQVDAEHAKRIEEYFVRLRDQIVDGIGAAIKQLRPAKLGYSHARCGFAMNRRLPSAGGFQNSPYPDGPVDHAVPLLRVEAADGQLLALMFGYACHNTTTAVMQFNGDYAGYAQAQLEADHPGTVAMFVLGCGGDQNPYPRGKIEMAQTHGQSLASAVETALLPAPMELVPEIKFAYEELELPFAPLSKEEIIARKNSSDSYDQRRGAALLAELESKGSVRESYPYPIQTLRLGQLTLIALGGEVVVDYSLRLKRELAHDPKLPIWVAGYSNDVMAYIPSERVLNEGGYEGGGAMRYSNLPNPWRSGVEDRIIGVVHHQVSSLR